MSSSISSDNAFSINNDTISNKIEELKTTIKDDFNTTPADETSSTLNTSKPTTTNKPEETIYNTSRPSEATIIASSVKNENISYFSQKIQEISQEIENFLENLSAPPSPSFTTQPPSLPSKETENNPSEIASFIENIVLNEIPILQGTLRSGFSLNPTLLSLFTSQENNDISSQSEEPDSKEAIQNSLKNSFTKQLAQHLKIPTKSFLLKLHNKEIDLFLPKEETEESNPIQKQVFKEEVFSSLEKINEFSPETIILAVLLAEINATSKIISNFVLNQQNQEPNEPYDDQEETRTKDDFLPHQLKILSQIVKRKLKNKNICLNNGEAKSILMLFLKLTYDQKHNPRLYISHLTTLNYINTHKIY